MHTYPLNDLRKHQTDKGAFCWCRPEYDEEYDLYVHRSMDGREEYEEGRKEADMKERVMVDSNGRKYITTEPEPKNKFNPDWDAIAVMVEEQQRMAKRIKELTKLVTSQGIRLMDSEVQPKKEWVELTDDEYFYLQMKIKKPMVSVGDYINAMKMVEKKLKDKNGF